MVLAMETIGTVQSVDDSLSVLLTSGFAAYCAAFNFPRAITQSHHSNRPTEHVPARKGLC